MKPVFHYQLAGDVVALTPDVNLCIGRAAPHRFNFIPDNIKVRYNNLAGQGVLAPAVVVGFPDLFIPLDGVVYNFEGLSQKYRNQAAIEGMSYTEWLKAHVGELDIYRHYAMCAGVLGDCQLEIWAW